MGRVYPHATREELVLQVDDRGLPIQIEELLDRRPHVLTKEERRQKDQWGWDNFPVYDYFPSGRLCLRVQARAASRQSSWRDRQGRTLEGRLGQALLGIEDAAEATRIQEQEYKRQAELRKIEERKRLRGQRLAEYRAWLANDLERMVAARQRSTAIHAFLSEYESHLGPNDREGDAEAWLDAARRFADRLDPFTDLASIAKDLEPSDEVLEAWVTAQKERGPGTPHR